MGYLPFAQNLREIGQYYNLYQDVMAYWHETMPSSMIYDLSYAKLVHDFEGNIRALLEHFVNTIGQRTVYPFTRTSVLEQQREPGTGSRACLSEICKLLEKLRV